MIKSMKVKIRLNTNSLGSLPELVSEESVEYWGRLDEQEQKQYLDDLAKEYANEIVKNAEFIIEEIEKSLSM